MPTFRLRRRLLGRLLGEARVVGELGLAFLMTAGVVASCGGATFTTADGGGGSGGTGESDGADDHPIIEACCIEAARGDGSADADAFDGSTVAEAAEGGGFFDADADAFDDADAGFDAPTVI